MRMVMLASVMLVAVVVSSCGTAPVCSPATCASCCDAQGVCAVQGQATCGLGGIACRACGAGQVCTSGACTYSSLGGGSPGGGSAGGTGQGGGGALGGGSPGGGAAGGGSGQDAGAVDAGDPCGLCIDRAWNSQTCAQTRSQCNAMPECAAYLQCWYACTGAGCAPCDAMLNTMRWDSYVAVIDTLVVCPCAGCFAACGQSCDTAEAVRTSPNRPLGASCAEPFSYDPLCASRICVDNAYINDAGVSAPMCSQACSADGGCPAMTYCDNGLCFGDEGATRCASNRRSVELLDVYGRVIRRTPCASNEQCNPATLRCEVVSSNPLCSSCTSDLQCASQICAGGRCMQSCASSSCSLGTCMAGRCTPTQQGSVCSTDRTKVLAIDSCGTTTTALETCTGTNVCRRTSRTASPSCGWACEGLRNWTSVGSGGASCVYTTYRASSQQCCGTCTTYYPGLDPWQTNECVSIH